MLPVLVHFTIEAPSMESYEWKTLPCHLAWPCFFTSHWKSPLRSFCLNQHLLFSIFCRSLPNRHRESNSVRLGGKRERLLPPLTFSLLPKLFAPEVIYHLAKISVKDFTKYSLIFQSCALFSPPIHSRRTTAAVFVSLSFAAACHGSRLKVLAPGSGLTCRRSTAWEKIKTSTLQFK